MSIIKIYLGKEFQNLMDELKSLTSLNFWSRIGDDL